MVKSPDPAEPGTTEGRRRISSVHVRQDSDPLRVTVEFTDVPLQTLDLLTTGGVITSLAKHGYAAYAQAARMSASAWDTLPMDVQEQWMSAVVAIVAKANTGYNTGTREVVGEMWGTCHCGHPRRAHDIEEQSGGGPRCCADKCQCRIPG